MTVMSFPYNLILIVMMENIFHLMLIELSAIFTHFTGNVALMAALVVATLRCFLLVHGDCLIIGNVVVMEAVYIFS